MPPSDAEFDSPQPVGPWESPWYLAVADFDGDGVEDVAAATQDAVVVARCNDDGTFGEEQRLEARWGDNLTTVSDLAGDGALDEAVPLTEMGQPGLRGTGREDLNRDGIADLLLFFRVAETGIACGDETATLRGVLNNGIHFEGTDSIVTRGCPPALWRHEVHGQ